MERLRTLPLVWISVLTAWLLSGVAASKAEALLLVAAASPLCLFPAAVAALTAYLIGALATGINNTQLALGGTALTAWLLGTELMARPHRHLMRAMVPEALLAYPAMVTVRAAITDASVLAAWIVLVGWMGFSLCRGLESRIQDGAKADLLPGLCLVNALLLAAAGFFGAAMLAVAAFLTARLAWRVTE